MAAYDALLRAAAELEDWLAGEQGTIDTMLVFAERGLQEAPLTTLLSAVDEEIAAWQREEIAESLSEALARIVLAVEEEYGEDWETAAWSHFRSLCVRIEQALDDFEP